jgi:glycine oxidase
MPSNSHSGAAPDVAVIGGGIIGCSIALRLAQGGLKVTVLEKGKPDGEASGAAAGMIAPQGEITEPSPFFKLCALSRDLYPAFVAEVEELTGKPVYYRRDGTLLAAFNDAEVQALDAAYKAQSSAGLAVGKLTPSEANARVQGLSPQIRQALYVAGDHWVDNEGLTQALVTACERLGVRFCPGVEVKRLHLNGMSLEGVEASANGSGLAKLSAGCFVIAAGAWSASLAESCGIRLPVVPCRGQIMEFEADFDLPMVVRAGHYYLVPRPGRRVLAGATSEYVGHQKAVTAEGLFAILQGVGRIAPFVKQLRFRRAWCGLRPDTADHLPVLGSGPVHNLVFATGHFRNGILLAPATAKLISELVLTGSPSHSLAAYSPSRFEELCAKSEAGRENHLV